MNYELKKTAIIPNFNKTIEVEVGEEVEVELRCSHDWIKGTVSNITENHITLDINGELVSYYKEQMKFMDHVSKDKIERSEELRYIKIGRQYEKAIHEELETFVVTYENDGDYSDLEIMLATCDEEAAMVIASKVPRNKYAFAYVRAYRGTECVRVNQLMTDTMKWTRY